MGEFKFKSIQGALKRFGKDCYGIGWNKIAGQLLFFLADHLEMLDTDALEQLYTFLCENSVIRENDDESITEFLSFLNDEEQPVVYSLDDPDDGNDELHQLISQWSSETDQDVISLVPESESEIVIVPEQEFQCEEEVKTEVCSVPEPDTGMLTKTQEGNQEPDNDDMDIDELPEIQPDWNQIFNISSEDGRNGNAADANDLIYTDRHGREYILKDILIEDTVSRIYTVEANEQVLAKIIHSDRRGNLERILDSVLHIEAESKEDNFWVFSKPISVIYNSKSECSGFVFRKVDIAMSLFDLVWDVEKRTKAFPAFTWKSMVAIAFNCAHVVRYMHDKKIVIGDICSSDIVVDKNGSVCFIAPERFDLNDPDRGIKYISDYKTDKIDSLSKIRRAPELRNAEPNPAFTEKTDDFWLAQVIFSMLTGGSMVFQEQNELADVYNIDGDGFRLYEDLNIVGHVTKEIQNMFVRVFENASDIASRPDAAEWERALYDQYNKAVCTANP